MADSGTASSSKSTTSHESKDISSDVKEADDDVVCCVCYNGDVEDENEIVICSGCDCAVHQGCYGIVSVPADDWYCKKCITLRDWEAAGKKTPKPEIKCHFCPYPNGAFSPIKDGGWCHTACASWIPEVGFNDPKIMDYVVGIDEVDPARYKTACELCGVKGGIIQCIHGVCRYAFHIMCGWKHKLRIEVREVPPIKDGDPFDVGQLAYCNAHRNEKFDPVRYVERNMVRYRDDPEVKAKLTEKEKREGKKKRKYDDESATDPDEEEEEEEESDKRKRKKGKSRPKRKTGKKSDKSEKSDDSDAEKPKKSEKAEKKKPEESVHKCPNCGSTDIGHHCSMKNAGAKEKDKEKEKEKEKEQEKEPEHDKKPRKRGRPKKEPEDEDGEVVELDKNSRRSSRKKKGHEDESPMKSIVEAAEKAESVDSE